MKQIPEIYSTEAKKWWKHKKATTVSLDYNGESYCKYHNTIVVKWTKTRVTLNSGGWLTNTTRIRFNEIAQEYSLHYNVSQTNFTWYIIVKTGHVCEDKYKTILFEDGISFSIKQYNMTQRCLDCGLALLDQIL